MYVQSNALTIFIGSSAARPGGEGGWKGGDYEMQDLHLHLGG